MNEIGNNGLYELLGREKKLDFVAFVMTQWHVHSLEAAIMMVEKRENRKLTGVVVIKPHPVSGFVVNNTSFSRMYEYVYFFKDDESVFDIVKSEIKGLVYYLSLKKSNRENFYFFRPTGFRYPILASIDKKIKKERKIVVVRLDEGTGTYLQSRESWFRITIAEQNSLLGRIKSCIKYCEESCLHEKKIENVNQLLDACLFKKVNEECVINDGMRKYYLGAIEDYAQRAVEDKFDEKSKYVIFDTQMPEALFKSGKKISDEIIKRSIGVFKKEGYRVYIKPHPRENDIKRYEKFDAFLIDRKEISQEAILALTDNKPKFIVGFCSTSLVTANALFGINAISLDDIVICNNEFQDSCMETVFKFKKVFKKNVRFIINFDELENYISEK